MDEYIENENLPSKIEQKYVWSCRICTAKEVINCLLKTNISEDDILSKIKYIDAAQEAISLLTKDKAAVPVKIIKNKYLSNHFYFSYINLEGVIKDYLQNDFQLIFEFNSKHPYVIPSRKENKKRNKNKVIVVSHVEIPDFKEAVNKETYNELKYQIIQETLQNKGAVTAHGSRNKINGFDDKQTHSFIIKSVCKDEQRIAKVIDCNYKRRNLDPEYFVPLELLSLEDIYVPRKIS